jgi:hypothetical protein
MTPLARAFMEALVKEASKVPDSFGGFDDVGHISPLARRERSFMSLWRQHRTATRARRRASKNPFVRHPKAAYGALLGAVLAAKTYGAVKKWRDENRKNKDKK